ncbi:MAG: histidine kinase [Woeseiaceae bacterium]|nr:histidine kinase [Woeseiaceae bacterium]
MAESREAADKQTQAYLPDFCAAGTILVILIVAELVAILLTLVAFEPGAFLTELSKMSMFVLWLALLGAGVLCTIRPWAEKQGHMGAFVVCFALLEVLCLVLAEITWQLTRIFAEAVIIDSTHGEFLLKTFAASSIVIALAMRYLYISSEWRRSVLLEAQSRISALQAMIRPHFLFNSMNTIASLTRTDPRRAEEAVEDLADLMRANLNARKDRTMLKEEIETAVIYQRIEKLRLGDRLRVRWDVDALPMRALIPSLTIQPLLENAIYHGIELLPDGGEVTISGRRDDDQLEIEINNPIAQDQMRRTGGNKMAMSNILQRFELAYGQGAEVHVEEAADHYRVLLRFPFEDSAQ